MEATVEPGKYFKVGTSAKNLVLPYSAESKLGGSNQRHRVPDSVKGLKFSQ
jgi:hypothetical protein